MKLIIAGTLSGIIFSACGNVAATKESTNLKEAFESKFHIGTAINTPQIKGTAKAGVSIIR